MGDNMKMKFVLNKDFGINGINKISFSEIEKNFSKPKSLEILKEKKNKYLLVTLNYEDINLIIYYWIDYALENKIDRDRALAFEVKKLYLNEKEYIEVDEDMRSALAKISRYCRKNNKDFKFRYEEKRYYGEYNFDELKLTLYFDRIGKNKYIRYIQVSLQHEKEHKYLTVKEILEM